jgi:hypothetical protein
VEYELELPTDKREQVEMLEGILIERATGSYPDNKIYQALRRPLLGDQAFKERLPQFVRTHRTLDAFWGWIKIQADTYAERRTLISNGFNKIVEYIENGRAEPSDSPIDLALSALSIQEVRSLWDKAILRRESDPEGAITIARTLIESVCKQILEQYEVSYSDKEELPKLYRKTAQQLNLSPEQHTEEIFKSILSGAFTMVNGLGTLRNKLSDSHGRAGVKASVKPSKRHATLAVNLAGTISSFLVETYLNNKDQ